MSKDKINYFDLDTGYTLIGFKDITKSHKYLADLFDYRVFKGEKLELLNVAELYVKKIGVDLYKNYTIDTNSYTSPKKSMLSAIEGLALQTNLDQNYFQYFIIIGNEKRDTWL